MHDNMLHAMQSLYNSVSSYVRINTGSLTAEWFEIISGLRQGCSLSPLLFNLFINVFKQIKTVDKGID
jgi:hypothetical protein